MESDHFRRRLSQIVVRQRHRQFQRTVDTPLRRTCIVTSSPRTSVTSSTSRRTIPFFTGCAVAGSFHNAANPAGRRRTSGSVERPFVVAAVHAVTTSPLPSTLLLTVTGAPVVAWGAASERLARQRRLVGLGGAERAGGRRRGALHAPRQLQGPVDRFIDARGAASSALSLAGVGIVLADPQVLLTVCRERQGHDAGGVDATTGIAPGTDWVP